MRQEAIVLRNGQPAPVIVRRTSACTGDCEGCGLCEPGQKLTVEADNAIGAEVGQTVLIETSTGTVLNAALLVYALPLVAFWVIYFTAQALGVSGLLLPLLGVLGFAASYFAARAYDRKRAARPVCTIVSMGNEGTI